MIAANVKRLRHDLRMTQAELARSCGVTPETISRIERGMNLPSLQLLDRISTHLGTKVSELVSDGAGQESRESGSSCNSDVVHHASSQGAGNVRTQDPSG